MSEPDIQEDDKLDSMIRSFAAMFQGSRIAKLRKPNLIGVGSGRCGTTYLFGLLNSAKEIYVTPVKEANYFGIRQQPFNRMGMTARDYNILFASHKEETYISEITPVYLCHPLALRLIRSELGPIKIIITLRNPISRLRSHYVYHQSLHKFQDLNAYVEAGMKRYIPEAYPMEWNAPDLALRMSRYAAGVSTALNLFGPENVLILMYEDLRQSHTKWIGQLEAFLGINFPSTVQGEAVNKSDDSGASFSPEIRQRLAEFFADDVKRLSSILKTDLNSYWKLDSAA